MTQATTKTIDPAVTNGSQLAANINDWRTAELSMHSGVARPSYATAGMMWISTASSPWVLNVFDGASDTPIGTVDPSSHVFTVTGGTAFTRDLLTASDAASARSKLQISTNYLPNTGGTLTGQVTSRRQQSDGTNFWNDAVYLVLQDRGWIDNDNYRAWFQVTEVTGSNVHLDLGLYGGQGRKTWEFREDGGAYWWGPSQIDTGSVNLRLTGDSSGYGKRLHIEERGNSDGPQIMYSKNEAGWWSHGMKVGTDGEKANFVFYWDGNAGQWGNQTFMISTEGYLWASQYGWLHDRFVGHGQQVYAFDDLYEFGRVASFSSSGSPVDLPDDYVLTGLRQQGDYIYLRGRKLRVG
ncbi:hypothetical protein [Martelella sp. HB161492]|uniref:hypothetical protein n=1 Tax=Martelella sp. HB161492 TaxID=2720726 RepID=UPI001591AFCC|nr:hypothetical protein [Martelella sp. HB161492]